MPSLWDLVEKPKEEPQKEVKEETPEVVEAAPVAKEETPKTTKAAKTTAKKETKKVEEEKFEYPFSLYIVPGEKYINITSFEFENGKSYAGEEISKILLQHRYYGFAGEITYSMIKDNNTLVATAKQFKKG